MSARTWKSTVLPLVGSVALLVMGWESSAVAAPPPDDWTTPATAAKAAPAAADESASADSSALSEPAAGAAAAPAPAPPVAGEEPQRPASGAHHRHRRHHTADDADDDEQGAQHDIVELGHDAVLEAGQSADSVVSIGGAARSAGSATEVISILGSTHVTGPTSDAVVAVLGDAYVDSEVGGGVVSFLGDVELGPHAVVDGDVSAVLGSLKRDPAARVTGDVISFGAGGAHFQWLRPWVRHCLLLGRLLGLDAGLGWAWSVALVMLAIYVLLGALFPRAIEACVHTLERDPGRTVLASFLMVLLVPLTFGLLAITFVGLIGWPFLLTGLFCATWFGKAALLAWISRRAVGARGSGLPVFLAVLLGGTVVLV